MAEQAENVPLATSGANNSTSSGLGTEFGDNTDNTTHEPTTSESVNIPSTSVLNKDELARKARAAGWTETTAFDYEVLQRSGTAGGEYGGAAAKYEWNDEYGDVAPEVPELEEALFRNEHTLREGAHRSTIQSIEVKVEGPDDLTAVRSFNDAGLHPVVLRNVELSGYTEPTPIQSYAIPAIAMARDVVAIAQTGSGKTAAYLIPIISRLMGKAKKLAAPRPDPTRSGYNPRLHKVRAEPLVLIVVPTRELAIQVFDEACRLCYRSMLRPCVAYGGLPMSTNLEDLGKGCDVLIGTPGRLCDLMSKPDVLTMGRVKFTVLDEADELLDTDWQEEMDKLLTGGDTNEDADHQYMMFSATFSKGAREVARSYMEQQYTRIRVGERFGQSHKNIRQAIIYVDPNAKQQAIYDLLFSSEPVRTLIFCNSKSAVDFLDDFLYNRELPTTSIHSDRTQREREDAIRAFRTGRAPILIATGVSARGLDIKDVQHVINFELPKSMHGGIQEYIHRIGRTARMGHQGLATSFYNDRDEDMAEELVKQLIDGDCEVPEFLQHYAPADGKIDWGDNTDDEADDFNEAGAGEPGWGGAATADTKDDAPATSWGANTAEKNDAGFAADTGFTADEGGESTESNW